MPHEPLLAALMATPNPNLTSLLLRRAPLTAVHHIVIRTPNLRSLYLFVDNSTSPSPTIASELQTVFLACPKLEILAFDDAVNTISAQQCYPFKSLKNLCELNLLYTNFEKAALPHFLGCLPKDTLKSFTYDGCDFTTPDLLPFIHHFRNLELLSMPDWKRITALVG